VAKRDQRDELTWVVVELSSLGERTALAGELEPFLRDWFPDQEIFLPYLNLVLDGRPIHFKVMEGYCFVSSGLSPEEYLYAARESPYLWQVLHSKGRNLALHTVPDETVKELSHKLSLMVASDIGEGMRVRITRGACENLMGEVLSVDQEKGVAQVLIETRTLKTIRGIPCYALLPEGELDV
jgi:hypothetical protein